MAQLDSLAPESMLGITMLSLQDLQKVQALTQNLFSPPGPYKAAASKAFNQFLKQSILLPWPAWTPSYTLIFFLFFKSPVLN